MNKKITSKYDIKKSDVMVVKSEDCLK